MGTKKKVEEEEEEKIQLEIIASFFDCEKNKAGYKGQDCAPGVDYS